MSGGGYPVLVPAVDADGNEVAGVRAPMIAAPLATHSGWNLRARGFGDGALYRFEGSTVPLPETDAERRVTGDPRRSIRERYPTLGDYTAAIRDAAQKLVSEALMLAEDVDH
ncbi:MAG: alpha/beta hydrolase domain-containing protein, partial [Pseudomonadota bacterium]|nr:alpha/beta hydrolase domain-containing protein [Pseudomonadota bacterium]